MNVNQARQIPLVAVLSRLGHQPTRRYKGGVELAYKSPFRDEKTPSFFVNTDKNVWYDFGDAGGGVLDFVMRHEQTDLEGAVAYLSRLFSSPYFDFEASKPAAATTSPPPKPETFVVTQILPFGTSDSLAHYIIQQRKIAPSVAQAFLQEIHFKNGNNGKTYFAVGFANNSGGYELKNSTFKTSVGQKDFSFFRGESSDKLTVFEGFMDFLSFLTLQNSNHLASDVLILNSTVFKKKAVLWLNQRGYSCLEMWLDNDKSGKEALHYFIENTTCQIVPHNHIYLDFKDLNDFLMFKYR